MSDLDLIRDDVEKYFAETETKHYNTVKEMRNQPMFAFNTLLKFAAMYKYERANSENEKDRQALPMQNVSGCFSELDMREAFKAGLEYERSCEYYSKQPKISRAGHIVSNQTPDFSEFIHNYNNR